MQALYVQRKLWEQHKISLKNWRRPIEDSVSDHRLDHRVESAEVISTGFSNTKMKTYLSLAIRSLGKAVMRPRVSGKSDIL